MLEILDHRDLAIELEVRPEVDTYQVKAVFSTAPMRVCQQMRAHAFAIFSRGIALRACCPCKMINRLDVLPLRIRRSIRYLDTTYDDCCTCAPGGDGWLGQEAVQALTNLEVVLVSTWGTAKSCEVSSALSRIDLRDRLVDPGMVTVIKNHL